MRATSLHPGRVTRDEWLEQQCRLLHTAGCTLAAAVEAVNARGEDARSGALGRRRAVTLDHLREVEGGCKLLQRLQQAIQDAIYDSEQEMRELRERELTPADLLVEGDGLIQRYRFLRRRNRILDGLRAELPRATLHALHCLYLLRRLREGDAFEDPLRAPGCDFALAALDELSGEGGSPS